ncbi:MAG TPA: efflux RND transporter periplasmic adaptor subunit [Polyangiaceae bacterium]
MASILNLRRLLVVAALIVGAVAIIASRFKPVPVTVSPVVRGKAVDAVYATGTVEAEDRVQVKAKSSGSIVTIAVKEGASVKKGDLLARIDNPVVGYDLKRGQADLSAASAQAGTNAPQLLAVQGQWKATEAELVSARQELARIEKLAQTGSISAAELDRGRARVAQLEGTLASNEAQQRALRIDLSANAARQAANVQSLASRVSDTEVRAPLDGVVLSKSIELGEVVGVNQSLFKLGDLQRLILEVSVDEADIGRVHDGKVGPKASEVAVSLYAFPRQVFRGHVFEILPDANRDRKAFLVKVSFDAPPAGLRSGMSAEVNIIAGEHEGAVLASTEAIADDAVWLVRDGRAYRTPVKIGVRDLLRAEILAGVREGDLLAVSGQDHLEEGKRVATTLRNPDKFEPVPDLTQPGQTSLR